MAWGLAGGRGRLIAAGLTSSLVGVTAVACGASYGAADEPPVSSEASNGDGPSDAPTTSAEAGDAGDAGKCPVLLAEDFASVPGAGWTLDTIGSGQIAADLTLFGASPPSLRAGIELGSGTGGASVKRTIAFGSPGVGQTTLAFSVKIEAPTALGGVVLPGPIYAEPGCQIYYRNGAGDETQATLSRISTGELGVIVTSTFAGATPTTSTFVGPPAVSTTWYRVRITATTTPTATISFEVTDGANVTLTHAFPAALPKDADELLLRCGIPFANLTTDAGAALVAHVDDVEVTRCAP